MVAGPLGEVLRRTLFELSGGEASSDAALLQRFALNRDEAAFAALVRRHGPMVLRVCRRNIRQHQDAEDAFQATFLVLARRAGAIRSEQLASWLYGVAWRIASKARKAAERRRAHEELPGGDLEPPAPPPEGESADLRPILDEEMARIPERYRAPLVLCYLEGRSVDEAAAELGLARGTVASRMSRGRRLLQKRLTKRGLALSAAALTAQLESTAGAAVPAAVLHTLIPAGFASGIGIREGAAILVKETLQSMFWSKIRWTGALLACLLVFGTATVKWTASSKPAANANVNARQGDDFYVRWRFDDGPPKDIQGFAGQWRWLRDPGKPGMMYATFFEPILPVRLPKRPFVLSIKFTGTDHDPRLDGVRWNVFLRDERDRMVSQQTWWKDHGEIKDHVWLRACFVERWCVLLTPDSSGKSQVYRVHRYDKPYPGKNAFLLMGNLAIEEIELRGLQSEEIPSELQNVEEIVKTMQGGKKVHQGKEG